MALTPRPSGPRNVALPEGAQWRRAAEQLAMRLGAFPGDTVAILAPASHDPAEHLAQRLPRVDWVQFGDGDRFGWHDEAPTVARVRCDILDPPIGPESIEALILVLPIPLLTASEHTVLVDAWRNRLQWYGKWLALLALDGVRDPRLKQAEADLKRAGFTRVRAQRLALGRLGAQLVLLSARRGEEDEAEAEAQDDDADDEDDE